MLLYDSLRKSDVPFATMGLIAINVLAWLVTLGLSDQQIAAMVCRFGLSPASFTDPALLDSLGRPASGVYALLTYMFVHADLPHLVGNMWAMWVFADNVEDALGAPLFLAAYFFSGLAAVAAHFVAAMHSPVPVVGASGAVAGMMGAYFWLFPRSVITTFMYRSVWRIPAAGYLGAWFLYQVVLGFVSGGSGSGVAWWAHVGGFLAGLLLAMAWSSREGSARRVPPRGVLVEHRSGIAVLGRRRTGEAPAPGGGPPGMVRHEPGLGVSSQSVRPKAGLGLVRHDKGIRVLGGRKKPPPDS